MVSVHPNGKFGNTPNLYREEPSKHMDEEVWVNHYSLRVADSWEQGTAYSLHAKFQEALKFKSPYAWYPKSSSEPELVYVGPSTLERILSGDKKAVFETSD